jgi:succinyl-CoA synthetase alpha subunit
MSIYINKNTKVVVQGITGKQATFHTKIALDYGSNIVAGVTPGRAGEKVLGKIPVFNTVRDALKLQALMLLLFTYLQDSQLILFAKL